MCSVELDTSLANSFETLVMHDLNTRHSNCIRDNVMALCSVQGSLKIGMEIVGQYSLTIPESDLDIQEWDAFFGSH